MHTAQWNELELEIANITDSSGDDLDPAVLVRVGQDQLGPGAVAVHHEVPNTPRLNLQTLHSAAAVNREYGI